MWTRNARKCFMVHIHQYFLLPSNEFRISIILKNSPLIWMRMRKHERTNERERNERSTHNLLKFPLTVENVFKNLYIAFRSIQKRVISSKRKLLKLMQLQKMLHFEWKLCPLVWRRQHIYYAHFIRFTNLIHCALLKYLQLEECNAFFFYYFNCSSLSLCLSWAIVDLAFLSLTHARNKAIKRNVRLTIDLFIFAINLKLEQFDNIRMQYWVLHRNQMKRPYSWGLASQNAAPKKKQTNKNSSNNNKRTQSSIARKKRAVTTDVFSHAFRLSFHLHITILRVAY